jgi:alpha/beta superfamily hydrolase
VQQLANGIVARKCKTFLLNIRKVGKVHGEYDDGSQNAPYDVSM